MVLLVLQFRLWDDLEDVERDRLAHPERVLSRSPVGEFRRLLAVLSGATLVGSAALSWTAFIGVAVLDACFLIAYRVVRPRVSDVTWRFPLLLAKYPAFVVLVAATMGARAGGRLTVAALVAMAGACVYEVAHQQRPAGGLS
jgi:hypothetical protein